MSTATITPTKLSRLGKAALAYAERFGWRVHPLKPGAKTPITSHGFKDASTDPEQIRAWWTEHPDANIGIATGKDSGISVLDVDVKDGAAGELTLRGLLEQHDADLTEHVCQRTASGGLHYVFAYDPRARQGTKCYGPGLDGRNDGGYIVAAPSIIDGVTYEWIVKPGEQLAIPEWLLQTADALAPKPAEGERKNPLGWADELMRDGVPFGQRDAEAWRLICFARETGKSESECLAILKLFGSHCTPPFDPETDSKIIAKIRRAYRKAPVFDGPTPKAVVRERAAAPDEEPTADAQTPGKPMIVTNVHGDWHELPEQAFAEVVRLNAPDPELFQRGIALSRVRVDEDGRPLIEPMTEASLKGHMASVMRWARKMVGNNGQVSYQPVQPQDAVVKHVMARKDWPGIPPLRDIIQAPIFAADGTLITTPGYHAKARLWYAPHQALEVTVPTAPTAADLERAREWLVTDLLGDFPFDSEASKAHALAAILLPFVRELIHGPTPLHLFTAPTPGSGKGLLVDIGSLIATGRPASMVSMPRDDEEMRKRITAQLRRGVPMIVLDNITNKLDSAALCSALTATEWEDRILGVSEMSPRLPNRAVWAATANNPELSLDIARRTVTCRLDPGLERPWERQGFKHPDLRTWALTHRAELVSAALTLVQVWLVDGAPRLEHPPIGSFESWAEVMAGVLGTAEMEGFLVNYRDVYESVSQDVGDWLTFVEAWYETHGGQPMLVKALHDLARQRELLGDVLGDGTDMSQRTKLGNALTARKGRVFAGYQLVAEKRTNHGTPYRLRVVA
jgi:hypothetical protein